MLGIELLTGEGARVVVGGSTWTGRWKASHDYPGVEGWSAHMLTSSPVLLK